MTTTLPCAVMHVTQGVKTAFSGGADRCTYFKWISHSEMAQVMNDKAMDVAAPFQSGISV